MLLKPAESDIFNLINGLITIVQKTFFLKMKEKNGKTCIIRKCF